MLPTETVFAISFVATGPQGGYATYVPPNIKHSTTNGTLLFFHTCSSCLSSTVMAALLQSITSENGRTYLEDENDN